MCPQRKKKGGPSGGGSANLAVESSQSVGDYHKRSLTICDGCFDTLNSPKMQS